MAKAIDIKEVTVCEMDCVAFGETCKDMFERGYYWSGMIEKRTIKKNRISFAAVFFKYAGPEEQAVNVEKIELENLNN
jgi:hypothetical protein